MAAHAPTTVRLTAHGRELIMDRIVDIRMRRIPELRPLLVEHERDERDVAAFEALLAEVSDLEGLLAESELVEVPAHPTEVMLGARIRVEMPDGSDEWIRPVHPREAVLDDERISVDSPLARALMGAQVNDAVTIHAPQGDWVCTVLEITA